MTRNILDTRDLLDELRELVGGDELNHDAATVAALDDDERERVTAITDLLDEIGSEARYGVALIPEDEFTEYAQELAEDIGAIGTDNQWPLYCIDWAHAARELQHDYSAVEFDGMTYLYRA